jgi:hypothetical protein
MSRPLRIEFPGAVYHVNARGDRRESIFADDEDRGALLSYQYTGLGLLSAVKLDIPRESWGQVPHLA